MHPGTQFRDADLRNEKMTNQISRNTRYLTYNQLKDRKEEQEKKQYEPSILTTRIYDMVLYSNNILLKYPKFEKYQLVRDIKACMDTMLEYSIELERKNARKTTLRQLDITNAKLQYYVRLSHEIVRIDWHTERIKDESSQEPKDWNTKEPPKHSMLDRGYISTHTYGVWSGKLEEIGRIIGGMIKAQDERDNRKNRISLG